MSDLLPGVDFPGALLYALALCGTGGPGLVLFLFILFLVTVVFFCTCFNWLNAAGIHRTLAKSRQIPVRLIENLFAVFVALVVTLSIRWVGILIINALLILPAAAGRNLSENMREYHFFSILFSLFSGLAGLFTSYYTNVATGPMIVIFATYLYFGTYLYKIKGV